MNICQEQFNLLIDASLSFPNLASLKITQKLRDLLKGSIPHLTTEENDRIITFYSKHDISIYFILADNAKKEVEQNIFKIHGYQLDEYLHYLVRKLSISIWKLNNDNILSHNGKLIDLDFCENFTTSDKETCILLGNLILDSRANHLSLNELLKFVISTQQRHGFKNMYDSFSGDIPKKYPIYTQDKETLTHREHVLINLYKEKAGDSHELFNRTLWASQYGSKRIQAYYEITRSKNNSNYKPARENELIKIFHHLSKFPKARNAVLHDLGKFN